MAPPLARFCESKPVRNLNSPFGTLWPSRPRWPFRACAGPRSALAFGALGEAPIAPNASRTLSLATSEPGFQIYGALLGADPALQMARGLYGPLVIDEPSPPEIDLEAIVLIADWRLDAEGQLADLGDAALGRGPGRVGATVTANGAPAPLRAFRAAGRTCAAAARQCRDARAC